MSLAWLMLFVCAAPSWGITLYVDNIAGNDLNSGLTATNQGEGAGPFRTIHMALKCAQRSDVISLAKTAVPYAECITLEGPRHSGLSIRPFVLQGNGAILDGSDSIPADAWRHVRDNVYRFEPTHRGIQVVLLDGQPIEPSMRFDQNAPFLAPLLKPKQWCRCRGSIHFATDKDRHPTDYNLRYGTHRVGITLYNVEHVVIQDLTVRGFQLDGINAHDNVFESSLKNVVAEANGRSGVSIGGASRVDVLNCQLQHNGETQLRTESWAHTRVLTTKFIARQQSLWSRHRDAQNSPSSGGELDIDGVRQFSQVAYPDPLAKPSDPLPEVQDPKANLPATIPPQPTPDRDDQGPFRDDPANADPATADANESTEEPVVAPDPATEEDPFSQE